MIKSFLFVKKSDGKGRGVFTKEKIPARTVIEQSPVLVLSYTDTNIIEKTKLHNYIFMWGENLKRSCVALGFCSIYNHSFEPNCEYEMDFEEETMTIITLQNIKKGEELFINYNGEIDSKSPMWFPIKRVE
jgi:uncharacterized protein